MAQLVPPFPFDHLVGVDLIDRPEVGVAIVKEDGLEDVVVVGDWRFVGVVIHTELVLVVCAVKGHLDLVHVFWVGMRVVHRSVTWRFPIRTLSFILGEGDLLFLLFILRFGAQLGVEMGFVVLLEVFRVGMCDGDVVEELGASQDKSFAPGGGFAKEFQGVVGEDTHDQVVECFGCGFGTGVAALTLARFGLPFFRVKGCSGENDALFGAGFDGGDVGVGADVDAFVLEIGGPVTVESLKMWEGDHLG